MPAFERPEADIASISTSLTSGGLHTCTASLSRRPSQVSDVLPDCPTPVLLVPPHLSCSTAGSSTCSLKVLADALLDCHTVVEFNVPTAMLAQRWEWQEGRYVPITWPNILFPELQCKLTLQQGLDHVSECARLPDVCINE
jgi:hypothetical protein